MSCDPLSKSLNKKISWFYIIAFINSAVLQFSPFMHHANLNVPSQIMNKWILNAAFIKTTIDKDSYLWRIITGLSGHTHTHTHTH